VRAPFIHSFIVDEWDTSNAGEQEFGVIQVRAPFIHSFIVDEWDTSNHGEPEGVRLTVRERSTFSDLSAEDA